MYSHSPEIQSTVPIGLGPVHDYFRKIYRAEYNSLNPTHQEVFKCLEEKVLDPGLNRTLQQIRLPDGSILGSREPVMMERRLAFINRILPRIFDDQGRLIADDFSFVMLDIVELGKMDDAGPEFGNWGVNQIANALQVAISELDVVGEVGRYGGDEDMIFCKKLDLQDLKVMDERIRTELNNVDGVYMEHKGEFVRKPLDFRLIKIDLPTDLQEREIFLTYIMRGQVIDEVDCKKIKAILNDEIESFKKRGINLTLADLLDESVGKDFIYGTEAGRMIDVGKKAEYLVKKHPEYLAMIELARIMDYEDGSDLRITEVVRFIENVVYSSIFKGIVVNFDDIATHLASGKYQKLFWVEGKFIKEENSVKSYYHGDEMMRSIYEVIMLTIDEEDREKVTVANRAGAFVVGVAETISLRSTENLSKLMRFKFNGKDIVLSVVSRDISSGDIENPNKTINELRSKADDLWYEKFSDFLDNNPELERQIIYSAHRHNQVDTFVAVLREFLFGEKRGEKHMTKLNEVRLRRLMENVLS